MLVGTKLDSSLGNAFICVDVRKKLSSPLASFLSDIVDADCHQLAETYVGDVYAHVAPRVTANRDELAQMYSVLGKAYVDQLAGSVWIDEISQQSSRQFLGSVTRLTINGDELLDASYHGILLGRRSLYRNLEKLRKFQRPRQQPSMLLLMLFLYWL